MAQSKKTVILTILGAVVGGVIAAFIGMTLEQRGMGPTGVGIAIGAAIGYVLGLPKGERDSTDS